MEFEIGEDIYITNEVTGNDGEICEINISSDYEDGSFVLFLTREQAEEVILALQKIIKGVVTFSQDGDLNG